MIGLQSGMIVPDGQDGVLIRVKAVPGASRNTVAGVLGEGDSARLKVRISAPAEGGKANKAICALLAGVLGTSKNNVRIETGATNPEKTVRVVGMDETAVRAALGLET